jgi:osmotically-inducible protein OsmY
MVRLQRISRLIICAGLLSASFGCAATQTHESTGQYVDDTAMTTKVKAAIFNEPTLKTLQISVKTNKGQAQLSGFVDSQQSVVRAGEVARGVAGIESVQNDLLVK